MYPKKISYSTHLFSSASQYCVTEHAGLEATLLFDYSSAAAYAAAIASSSQLFAKLHMKSLVDESS